MDLGIASREYPTIQKLLRNMSKLRHWQYKPLNQLLGILSRGQNALDISDTGTGKTYVACAVASIIRQPTLAVVPKIAVHAWKTAAEHLGIHFPIVGYEAIRTGRTNLGQWENQPPVSVPTNEFFLCESCQCVVNFDDYRPCYCHPAGFHCIKTKRKPWKYGKFIWDDAIKFIIFDEVHRCSGLDSLNADMLIAAKRQGIRVLGLSATAACTPLQMRALGYLLDLHGLNQQCAVYPKPTAVDLSQRCPILSPVKYLSTFYQWASKYDCRPDPVYRGLKWFASAARQVEIMEDIHTQLVPSRGVRVRTTDIPDFPERQVSAELYDLEKDYEIEKLYQEMADALSVLSDREARDANTESPLTRVLRARQRIELLIVPILTELAEDALAKGNSVAIFVCFKATIEELGKRLQTSCIVDGTPDGVRERQNRINRFQANEERLIICNNAAGGIAISLHDERGGHPRVGLVSPGFSAVEFRQVLGRLHRSGAKSPAVYKVVFTSTPTGKKIKKSLDAKLNCLDALTDGDFLPV